MGIPGVGPITASVLASEIGDGTQFRSGRDFAASVGLVRVSTAPAENPTFSGSVDVATVTCEVFLCSAPGRTCASWTGKPVPSGSGPARLPAGVARTSWGVRSPTRWLASHGRSSPDTQALTPDPRHCRSECLGQNASRTSAFATTNADDRNGTPACGEPPQVMRLLKPHDFMGPQARTSSWRSSLANGGVHVRFEQANTATSMRSCKSGAEHGITSLYATRRLKIRLENGTTLFSSSTVAESNLRVRPCRRLRGAAGRAGDEERCATHRHSDK